MFSECFGQDVFFLCKADINTLDNSRSCKEKKKELEHASQVLNFLDWKTWAETISCPYTCKNRTTVEHSLTAKSLLKK